MAWARRRAAPGQSAPPLSKPQTAAASNQEGSTQSHSSKDDGRPRKDDFVHLYETKEECASAAKLRNESLGPVPTSHVLRSRQENK